RRETPPVERDAPRSRSARRGSIADRDRAARCPPRGAPRAARRARGGARANARVVDRARLIRSAPMKQTAAKLRKICLSFPDTTEGVHGGGVAFKVKTKMFATYRDADDELVLAVAPKRVAAVLEDERYTAYPRAKGAIRVRVAEIDDWDDLKSLLLESYDLVA